MKARSGEVLAVKREKLFEGGNYFEGFMLKDYSKISELENNIRSNQEYFQEWELENRPEYKQIVTYCILFDGDSKKVFSYIRGGKEPRLKDKLSIGIGGHIHRLETKGDIIRSNIMRKVEQEVGVGIRVVKLEQLGYINCEDIPVDKDHFALLFLKEVWGERDIKVKSSDLLEGKFRSQYEIEELMQKHEFEDWSRIAYDELKKRRLMEKDPAYE